LLGKVDPASSSTSWLSPVNATDGDIGYFPQPVKVSLLPDAAPSAPSAPWSMMDDMGWGHSYGGVDVANSAFMATRERVLANLEVSRASRPSQNIELFYARSNQIESGYLPDNWILTTLEKSDVVYGGLPGPSAYYAPGSTLEAASGSSVNFFTSVQAEKHPFKGHRPEIGEYVVTEKMTVPTGTALNNPLHGPGGQPQYFIRSYQKSLELQQRIPFGVGK
jgi:hypothetical protein